MNRDLINVGKTISNIPVRISYRIIELFSDGLYSSPNKAIEELVSNSYDADAQNVSIYLSPDRSSSNAFIIVIDDGEGMDDEGLRQHWLIGVSNKRDLTKMPHGRKQIGKFGIGKLATFVLARKLTHICKRNNRYLAVTMNYDEIPQGRQGSVELDNEGVNLPLRELTEDQIREILPNIVYGNKPGYKAIELFGPKSPPSWTVAILSDLKDMARNIQKGRLIWVLQNAMPIRSDFKLYLDGEQLHSTKLDQKPLKRWVLGKDLKTLGSPAPDDLEISEDPTLGSEFRWGLTHPHLGRITGFAEVYERGLSDGIDRNHGFFVYVYKRLLNISDSHFGIPPNALRHGTFTRFRMVVHIDRLDEELRSSRETVRDTELAITARNILHAVFNAVRNWLNDYDEQHTPGFRAAARIRQSAGSLTRRPILNLLKLAIDGQCSPKLIYYPRNLSESEKVKILDELEERSSSDEGLLRGIKVTELTPHDGIAKFEVVSGELQINSMHPFVSAYPDDFEKDDTLSLLCMAEVLTEAYLYNLGIREEYVIEIMSRRDELLRQFAHAQKRNANLIAQDLLDSVTDQHRFELELVAAFQSLGFDARHIGGSGKPDGKAIAYLSAREDKQQQYAISLEAKSKEKEGDKVTLKNVLISRIAAHRDENECNHAVIVGPDFATSRGDNSALVKDARSNKEQTGKTITIMLAQDLARLVRLRTLKHVGLDRLRDLFNVCVSPEEVKAWIDTLEKEKQSNPPYLAILDSIWNIQQQVNHETVEFSAVTTYLRIVKEINLDKQQLINICKTMAQLVPNEVVLRETSVELNQRPDIVFESMRKVFKQFQESWQLKLRLE